MRISNLLVRTAIAVAAIVSWHAASASIEVPKDEVHPLWNKTVVLKPGLGNGFNKFWITDKGRVIWFFGDNVNEAVVANLNGGIGHGRVLLKYDQSGSPAFGKNDGSAVLVLAPYQSLAMSNDKNDELDFAYSFTANHATAQGARVVEEEMTTLKVVISDGGCTISGMTASSVKRDDAAVRKNNLYAPDSCSVIDGNQ